jgi:hypothetical protein
MNALIHFSEQATSFRAYRKSTATPFKTSTPLDNTHTRLALPNEAC